MIKEQNELLIETLEREGYLKTPTIKEAFREIDRSDFVPKEYKNKQAYENVPLPIGFGQTISQPLVVAFMMELLSPQPGEKVLEIGVGSGWQTAILAYLTTRGKREEELLKKKRKRGAQAPRTSPHVVGIERIPELREMAEYNLKKYGVLERGVVELFTGDGAKGWEKEAPYDKIIAGAAAEGAIPEAWKTQLKINGRIVAPVEHSIIVLEKIGSNEFTKKEYFGFSSVPLIEE